MGVFPTVHAQGEPEKTVVRQDLTSESMLSQRTRMLVRVANCKMQDAKRKVDGVKKIA